MTKIRIELSGCDATKLILLSIAFVMQYLGIWDALLTPVYLIILIAIAKRQRDKKYPNGHQLRRYFLPGLFLKFFGVVFIALIYQYYYKGGDTFSFFSHAKIINSALDDSFATWLKLLFHTSVDVNPEIYPYVSQMSWYQDLPSYTVAAIAAIFGLLNGNTYIPTALLFAFFSYTGVWAMYRTYVNLYPKLHKPLAVAFLFIPSTYVWGSAIFKDTICMFGLGWLTYTTFRLFVNKDLSVKNVVILIFSFYLIALVKIYILLAFLPALSMWLLLMNSKRLPNLAVRLIVTATIIGFVIAGSLYFMEKFSEELNRYSLDAIVKTSEATRGWISYASGEEGSSYDLGEMDGSIESMLKKFPAAIVVTFFRPFPWEVKKIIVLLSAFEAIVFLCLTVWVIVFRLRILKNVVRDPNLLFFAVYSLIFGFAVGISSYNFGALSRYKIPCLPFYAAFLAVLLCSKSTSHLETALPHNARTR